MNRYGDPMWIGYKKNRLTVINIEHLRNEKGKAVVAWLVKCDCGTEKIVSPRYVVEGKTKSCGCYRKEENFMTHGKSGTKLYRRWIDMKNRCEKNRSCSKYHGDRGIKVCDEWKTFENFEKWAIENGYNDNLSIERINVNGNYEPQNCKWIPIRLQSRNRRNTIFVEYKGERMPLGEACERAELPYMIVFNRIYKYGWSVKNALETGVIRR